MNCKPGDLAIVIKSPQPDSVGRIVKVLERAPESDFVLPDGALTDSAPNAWVIEFPHPVVSQTASGMRVRVLYGACLDAHLRPIRDPGDDAKDEMLRPLPIKEVA